MWEGWERPLWSWGVIFTANGKNASRNLNTNPKVVSKEGMKNYHWNTSKLINILDVCCREEVMQAKFVFGHHFHCKCENYPEKHEYPTDTCQKKGMQFSHKKNIKSIPHAGWVVCPGRLIWSIMCFGENFASTWQKGM